MDDDKGTIVIGPYEFIQYGNPEEAYRPYDPRCPAVAERVTGLIRDRNPDVWVEHVGSTAIPDCPGKGVIDLMVLYAPGQFEAARDAVDSVGFQRFVAAHAHPEERPVRIGTLELDGELFRIHVHIIAADSPEVETQRRFRDRLRADPALVEEYAALKRAVLASGVGDSNEYNQGKESFIRGVVGD